VEGRGQAAQGETVEPDLVEQVERRADDGGPIERHT
jgi:hypothetical protein